MKLLFSILLFFVTPQAFCKPPVKHRTILTIVEHDIYFKRTKLSQINDSVAVIHFLTRDNKFSKVQARTIDSLFQLKNHLTGKTYVYDKNKDKYCLSRIRDWVDGKLIQTNDLLYVNEDTVFYLETYKYKDGFLSGISYYSDTILIGEYKTEFYEDSVVHIGWSNQTYGLVKTILFKKEIDLQLRNCDEEDPTCYYIKKEPGGYYLHSKERRGQYWLSMSVKTNQYNLWQEVIYSYKNDYVDMHSTQNIITRRKINYKKDFLAGTKPLLLTALSHYLNYTRMPYSQTDQVMNIPIAFK